MRFGAGFALAGLFSIGLAAVGCGETENPSGCTAGESASCTCEGGGNGVQLCGDDGSFGPCACGTGGSGGAAGAGGGAGAGGTGGSAGHGGSGGTGAGGSGGSGGVGGTGGTAGAGGVGGEGGSGGSGGTIADPVCSQIPDCEPKLDSTMDFICTLDGCVDAGQRDGAGAMLRGKVQVVGSFDPVTTTASGLKSYELRLFHPENANGTRLHCADIKADADRADPLFNVVSRSVGGMNLQNSQSSAPTWAQFVPATEEGALLIAWVRFYGGSPDTSGEPTGSVVLEGCTESVRVVPGAFVEDEDHVYLAQMKR